MSIHLDDSDDDSEAADALGTPQKAAPPPEAKQSPMKKAVANIGTEFRKRPSQSSQLLQ